MIEIKEFISELKSIEEKLHFLESKYNNGFPQEMNKNIFDTQNKCSTEIENTIHLLTHELATEIAFGTFHLQQLITYNLFRKKYSKHTDKELSSIIDANLTSKQKKDIFKGKTTQYLKKIKTEWNMLFKNKNYNKIKEKLNV